MQVEEIIKRFEKAKKAMDKKDPEKAAAILEEIIEANIETFTKYQNTETTMYYNFETPMEELIFKQVFRPKVEVKRIQEPFAPVFHLYAMILLKQEDYVNAMEAIMLAVRWNPVSSAILLTKSEIEKTEAALSTYQETVREALTVAYTPTDIARCYRAMGYYYGRIEDFRMSYICYYLSTKYEESEIAAIKIEELSDKAGKYLNAAPLDIQGIFERERIQYGASKLVIQAAYNMGMSTKELGRMDMAKYFLTIVYNLTSDAALGEELAAMEQEE